MEIQVAKLREALGILKPAVPRKPTLDILKNVLVKEGKVVATDLDSMVVINLPEAADESFVFPYDDVLQMLQYVPGHDYLKMDAKRGKLTLSWSEGSATYPTKSPEEFPPIPDFEVKAEAAVDSDTLIPALVSVLPYVATGGNQPVLNGVTVVFGEPIEISAGDGYRLAHIVLPLLFPGEFITIIPRVSVSTLTHVWEKTPRTPSQADALMPIILAKRQIQVALDGKGHMRMVFGSVASVIIKLVEGQPPAWLKLIPKEEPVLKAIIFAREFETAVRRVSKVASQNNGIVRLQFNDSAVRVSAKADGQEVTATITALDITGTPNRFALNVRDLTSYLKDKSGIVSMSWTGNNAPVAFEHSNSPKVLIMPMAADWGNEQPKAETKPEGSKEVAPAEANPGTKTSKPQRRPGKKEKK